VAIIDLRQISDERQSPSSTGRTILHVLNE